MQNGHLPFATSGEYECSLRRWQQEINHDIRPLTHTQYKEFEEEEVLLTIEGVSSTSFTILEDDISRLTYVLKLKIQTIQFPTIILKFSRIIVTKESDFIKAYTIRVFLILLYDRNESFIILYIVMQFGHIFTNCP